MKTKQEQQYEPCGCGKGHLVMMPDGSITCSWTLSQFESRYGYPHKGADRAIPIPTRGQE